MCQLIFFHPSFLLLFVDPGSGMGKNQDPGSGINIPDPQHCFQSGGKVRVFGSPWTTAYSKTGRKKAFQLETRQLQEKWKQVRLFFIQCILNMNKVLFYQAVVISVFVVPYIFRLNVEFFVKSCYIKTTELVTK